MKSFRRLITLLLVNGMVLSLMMVGRAVEKRGAFADIPADAGYAGAVEWCYDRGILKGVSKTAFAPDAPLSRAMLVTALYRAAGEPAAAGRLDFSDVREGAWYSDAVLWANAQGLVQGYGNGLFGTDDPVSEEQLEVILGRYTGAGTQWRGDPKKARAATRAQIAVALMAALGEENPDPETDPETTQGGRVLVAYFSATGTTPSVAEKVAQLTGGDLFEIVPAQAYTSADLNYHTDCRANAEQNDPDARPAIAGTVEDMDRYDVVFIGYPIWWGRAPKIIHTFLETYDLGGKTIATFCTSGSSGHENASIWDYEPDATWLEGRRFSGISQVESWVNGLGLPSGD